MTRLTKPIFTIMTRFLTPSISKMMRNHISSVESRVMNLTDVIKDISVPGIAKNIIDVTHAIQMEETLDFDELKNLISFYSDECWVYGGKK